MAKRITGVIPPEPITPLFVGRCDYHEAIITALEKKLQAAKSILWMAERYAEGGGSNGPEIREYEEAIKIIESK